MKRLPSELPEEWNDVIRLENLIHVPFRSLLHFKTRVAELSQKDDDKCGVTYEQAVDDLRKGKSSFNEKKYESVRNLVRQNLLKKGMITKEIYENFKYSVDGTVIDYDVGKIANGEPDCVITPAVDYVDYFYELYINPSYPYQIPEEFVIENINKLLATIEEMQRQHIFIKITVAVPNKGANMAGDRDFLSTIPMFSHKDVKDPKELSSVINNRLLRKFYFAIFEDSLGDDIAYGYGNACRLPKAMNIWDEFNEVEFFTDIRNFVEGK